MPKPSRLQLQQFKAFQRRQSSYEKQYQKYFFAYLRKTYNQAARDYIANKPFTTDPKGLETILRRLYYNVTLKEAVIAHKEVLAPIEGTPALKTKDIIDDLVGMFSNQNRGLVNIWRSLLDTFLQVRLTNRITLINRTTEERIARIIEDGMFEGQGQEEVARRIRKEASSNININRARSIARTETVVASNQGAYLNAKSSNIVLEKKWHPANDPRTRISHIDMLNREWIDIDAKFWIANEDGYLEEALYPGDQTLSASNVINCRCKVIFQPVRDFNGRVIPKM